MKNNLFLLIALLIQVCGWITLKAVDRPNVILIMVDDMGFSDLGYHGGEIDTPNLDALAKGGVRFSQFYNSGRCCPTRATLMTGLHPHEVGIGHMTQPPSSNRGKDRTPAYQGYLNRQCVTIAEALEGHNYATLMAGFEKYFGCISGATRFFHPVSPRDMTFGNTQLTDQKSTTEEAFYTTDAFTDYAIRFLKEEQAAKKKRPAFLYLAYTAPHWPLQAFEDDIAKYRGKYKIGWDKLRQQRLKRQIASGLIRADWDLSPRTPGIPDWDSLSEDKQDEMDLKMAVYAAMIDRVDQNIGKLVAHLNESKTFDNTLIFFLADNGGCQEGGMFGRGNFYNVEKRNQEHSNSYGEAWANASNTPFRLYKHFVHEGGAATPFFMHWPKGVQPRKDWYGQPAQLIDIMPTILDVTGVDYPKTYKDNEILPIDGISLRPAFAGKPLNREGPFFVEHENNAFVRDGKWKLVGRGVSAASGVVPSRWELYDIEKDRTETNNLADFHPDKAKDLAEQWNVWAKRAKVYPKKNKASDAKALPNPPQVTGRPFTITAEIEHAKPKGVLISHGGVQFGYALYFVKGRPAFCMRNRGELTELVAKKAVKGRVTVSASLDDETLPCRSTARRWPAANRPDCSVGSP
jgi:arylsulfatase A-like enzyme